MHFGSSLDFLYCSYAKILGETNFQPQEFPQSGSKAKDGERERLNNGNNNGQATHGARKHDGARKPPGPINLPTVQQRTR